MEVAAVIEESVRHAEEWVRVRSARASVWNHGEIACAWSITPRWTLTSHLRLHLRTGADFWHRAYAVSSTDGFELPRYRSGDRRLSPLVTSSGGLDVSFAIGPAERPSGWTLLLGSDFANTQYFDALYVTSRNSLLGTFAVQGAFE